MGAVTVTLTGVAMTLTGSNDTDGVAMTLTGNNDTDG